MNTEFVESRQACDKASSWCRQDPTRLMSASDTQAGRERNTKMAAACSICLHDAMCDVVVKDILNKTFFPILQSPKSNRVYFFFFYVDLLYCRSVLLLLLLLSVFNKDPRDLVKQKLPWSCLTSPS